MDNDTDDDSVDMGEWHYVRNLINASYFGFVEEVRRLLNDDSVDVNEINDDMDGATPLICASMHGNSDVVRELLNHDKVDVNAMDYFDNSALIHACNYNHVDIVCASSSNMTSWM
ncbi:hypothetical protein MHU86_19588 [Fragilaria crotonensis]|nr:hypothetical protein MHU86_19588 [Fragilaria crotonensis]